MVNFTAADRVGSIGGYIGGIATLANAMGGCNNGLFGNLFGNNCHPIQLCSESTPVTRYELGMAKEIAAKDSENALLRAQIYTNDKVDEKLVEVVRDYTAKFNSLADEVRGNKAEQDAINREQAVYNGINTATISCIKGQVDELLGITKRVIPNASVCPGWGDVGIHICPPCGSGSTSGNSAK